MKIFAVNARSNSQVCCVLFVVVVSGVTGCACPRHPPTTNLVPHASYPSTPQALDIYLKEMSKSIQPMNEKAVEIGRRFIGQKYVLGPLGEFPFEKIDANPLYRLDASDCVTFVEQTWAMAMASNWSAFSDFLMKLRYKDAQIGILSRNHFTEADWNLNNAWAFEDVTRTISGGNTERYKLKIDRTSFFLKLGLSVSVPIQEWDDEFIRLSEVPRFMGHLQSGDIVEFVKNPKSPFVGHMGILSVGDNGAATLIHATRPSVREQDLMEYLSAHPDFAGIKVLRYRGRGRNEDS